MTAVVIVIIVCVAVLVVVGWVFWDRQQQRVSASFDEAGGRGGAPEVDAMGRAYGEAGRYGASPPGLTLRLGRWVLGLFQRHRDEPPDENPGGSTGHPPGDPRR